ncbi:MAG: hypothetical protein JWM89_1317 [Acidimicrobiales bacterium]|nr:hypothetical protein [Acidimicrobiales bacterium]
MRRTPVAQELFTNRDPSTPLLIHVGNARDAVTAQLRQHMGQLVWRGRAGADQIRELGADPVDGADAMFDFASYEYKEFGKDGSVAVRLDSSRLAAAFAPGFFADHTKPDELSTFFNVHVPTTHELIRLVNPVDPIIPTVALTDDWLTKRELLDVAIDCIRSYDGVVGLVLASPMNPLGAAAQICGFVELLQSTGNVIALRQDESAIGALAHGALAASIGTSSTVRHLFFGRPSKTRGPRPNYSVLHPQTLSWIRFRELEAFTVAPEDQVCDCVVCDGRTLARYHDPALAIDAMIHSMLVLQERAASVVGAADPIAAWFKICTGAATSARRIESTVEGFSLGRSVKAWSSALQPSA